MRRPTRFPINLDWSIAEKFVPTFHKFLISSQIRSTFREFFSSSRVRFCTNSKKIVEKYPNIITRKTLALTRIINIHQQFIILASVLSPTAVANPSSLSAFNRKQTRRTGNYGQLWILLFVPCHRGIADTPRVCMRASTAFSLSRAVTHRTLYTMPSSPLPSSDPSALPLALASPPRTA